jgi:DNA-binding protein HU-beta
MVDAPRIVYFGLMCLASKSNLCGFIWRVPLMATAPGKATPTTVTLKHLAAALAESHEMSKKQAETVLGDLVDDIVKHLKKGERIRIGGLGILQVRKRAARMGRNPATGEQIQIKASKKVAFRASKELKESI